VVRPGKLSVIGNGVVVDPWALLAEIERCASRASRHPGQPAHRRERDADPAAASRTRRLREAQRGERKIGTTGAASARPTRTRSAGARSA
jgi:adenylosuccinate synthase